MARSALTMCAFLLQTIHVLRSTVRSRFLSSTKSGKYLGSYTGTAVIYWLILGQQITKIDDAVQLIEMGLNDNPTAVEPAAIEGPVEDDAAAVDEKNELVGCAFQKSRTEH